MKKKNSKEIKTLINFRAEENLKEYLKKASKADGCNTLTSWIIVTLRNAAKDVLGYAFNERNSEEKLLK